MEGQYNLNVYQRKDDPDRYTVAFKIEGTSGAGFVLCTEENFPQEIAKDVKDKFRRAKGNHDGEFLLKSEPATDLGRELGHQMSQEDLDRVAIELKRVMPGIKLTMTAD